MRNLSILVGAAALAITAPVLAQPGKGNGGGNKGGGGPAKVERGGGGGPKAARGGGGQAKVERGGGGGAKAARGGGGPRIERGGGDRQRMAAPKMRGSERREVRVERRAEKPQRQLERGPAKVREVREVRREEQRGNSGKVRVAEERGRGAGSRNRQDVARIERADTRNLLVERRDYLASPAFRSTGLIDGCPPGLAARNNGCLPPGQAKKLVGAIAPAVLGSALLPPLYRSWYPDNDDYFYRTRDGYVYQIDRDRNYVDAYWPLANDWDGAYYVGAAYPDDYLGYYNVPVQYRPWYADDDDSYYRYGDGAIYQVDRQGGVIESIVSLLAGGFGVGQPMPAGYDVYNVPYDYRDRYVDSQDSWYRYNDGYIYQVDPTTQIVQAIVETLV